LGNNGGGDHDERTVPAEIIALIYSQRRIIEIFFRFFKQFLGCSHLVSNSQNGIEIQCYCAIIACLLINLWTGRKPTKCTFEMISYYFMGLASEEELIGHFEKLKAHDEAKSKNSKRRSGSNAFILDLPRMLRGRQNQEATNDEVARRMRPP
jgi:hypothetical protein